MILSTPEKNEAEFKHQWVTFVNKEHPRKVAMRLNQFRRGERTVLLQGLRAKSLGNALALSGTLLKPGIFVGLDGIPTKYTEEFIRKVQDSIIGTPIYFAHDISPESMDENIPQGTPIGFWTGSQANGELRVRGYVFDPRAIRFLKRHPNIGLSVEALVTAKPLGSDLEEAKSGKLTGGVLIDDPACPSCRVHSIREINLERGKKMGEEDLIEFKADAKPSREDFFAWLEKQLKSAGIPENIIPKAMAVMRKAIKVPYPYPYPKAAELFKALAEDNEELAKELASYQEYMKACLKTGKSMKECAAEYKSNPAPKAGEIEELKAELEATNRALEQLEQEKIDEISNDIKLLDPDFDATKLLEGVECKRLQRKMLERYRDTLKKHVRPIKLQIAGSDIKTKAEKLVHDMFGSDADIAALLEEES